MHVLRISLTATLLALTGTLVLAPSSTLATGPRTAYGLAAAEAADSVNIDGVWIQVALSAYEDRMPETTTMFGCSR